MNTPEFEAQQAALIMPIVAAVMPAFVDTMHSAMRAKIAAGVNDTDLPNLVLNAICTCTTSMSLTMMAGDKPMCGVMLMKIAVALNIRAGELLASAGGTDHIMTRQADNSFTIRPVSPAGHA